MPAEHRSNKLFNFTKDSYLERTSRPIYAVIFLLPFIIFYEVGTILINTDVLSRTQIRVVAFVWLQRSLEQLGLSSRLALAAPPMAVVLILLAMQLTSRKQWRFWLFDVCPMTIECILLAVPLIVLSLFLHSSIRPPEPTGHTHAHITNSQVTTAPGYTAGPTDKPQAIQNTCTPPKESLIANIVTGIGAGIYEELVFRLVLICASMLLLQDLLGFGQKSSIITSVVISAALFSAHHHVDFVTGQINLNTPFNWTEFGFRTIAGIYFALLFAIRGFGITAGAHAFYDIIATVVNAAFFHQ